MTTTRIDFENEYVFTFKIAKNHKTLEIDQLHEEDYGQLLHRIQEWCGGLIMKQNSKNVGRRSK